MWSGETESGKVSSIREWRGVMYSRSKQGQDYHQIIGHVPGSLPVLPSLLRSVMIGVGL